MLLSSNYVLDNLRLLLQVGISQMTKQEVRSRILCLVNDVKYIVSCNNMCCASYFIMIISLLFVANIFLGSGSLIGKILPFVSPPEDGVTKKILPTLLSPLQVVLHCFISI